MHPVGMGWLWFVVGIGHWSEQQHHYKVSPALGCPCVHGVVKWTGKDYIQSDPWLPWPNCNQHISKCNQIICKLIFFCQHCMISDILWYYIMCSVDVQFVGIVSLPSLQLLPSLPSIWYFMFLIPNIQWYMTDCPVILVKLNHH